MAEISVVVPVFNAEKTIRRCLDSILNQTFGDFEVLIVDDGSDDNTAATIKQEYVERDKRYKLWMLKPSGPSAARNVALKHITGSIVVFIDADDFIEKDYFLALTRKFRDSDADVVFIGCNVIDYRTGNVIDQKIPQKNDTGYSEVIEYLSDNDLFGYTWIKAFKFSAIEGVFFQEGLNLFEDELFACEILKKHPNIAVLSEALYDYVVGNGTALTKVTYQDYPQKCDLVYKAWKEIEVSNSFLVQKSRMMVEKCRYYLFEHSVNLRSFVDQVGESKFFSDSQLDDTFSKSIRSRNYLAVWISKWLYNGKVMLANMMKGGSDE